MGRNITKEETRTFSQYSGYDQLERERERDRERGGRQRERVRERERHILRGSPRI